MPPRGTAELFGTSHFRVVIGRRELGFSEVGPLTSETDLTVPAEERTHGFSTVVLRRALTRSTELYDWRRRIVQGKNDRRPVTIQQLAAAGGEVVNAWRLEGAWPCRWSGPQFDAASGGIAIEEVELAFDDLVWLQLQETAPVKASRTRTQTEGA
jgi:phage tail-like protein